MLQVKSIYRSARDSGKGEGSYTIFASAGRTLLRVEVDMKIKCMYTFVKRTIDGTMDYEISLLYIR